MSGHYVTTKDHSKISQGRFKDVLDPVSAQMSEHMSERMPEDMSEHMSEQLNCDRQMCFLYVDLRYVILSKAMSLAVQI